jgi:hypothetical protein
VCTRLAAASDKVLQLLAHGRWFSSASSTTKTGRHDISEILLKVALNTKNQSINQSINQSFNLIDGVMVSVLALIAVYHGFNHLSGQTKDNENGICCFSAKHAVWRSKHN